MWPKACSSGMACRWITPSMTSISSVVTVDSAKLRSGYQTWAIESKLATDKKNAHSRLVQVHKAETGCAWPLLSMLMAAEGSLCSGVSTMSRFAAHSFTVDEEWKWPHSW